MQSRFRDASASDTPVQSHTHVLSEVPPRVGAWPAECLIRIPRHTKTTATGTSSMRSSKAPAQFSSTVALQLFLNVRRPFFILHTLQQLTNSTNCSSVHLVEPHTYTFTLLHAITHPSSHHARLTSCRPRRSPIGLP